MKLTLMLKFTNHSTDDNRHDLKPLLKVAIICVPGKSSNINLQLLKYKL